MTEIETDTDLQVARSHHQAGRLVQAEKIYRQVLDLQPDNAGVLSKLGAALAGQRRLDEALSVFRRAIDLDPDLVDALNNLGAVCRLLGKHDDAVTACQKALDLDPDSVSALVNLGAAYQQLGRMEEAIDCTRKAISLNPDLVEAHVNLGAALQKLGRLEDAVVSYRKALDVNPDWPDAHVHLGTALQALGRSEAAIESYRNALAIQPGLADAHANMGTAYRHLGQMEDAIASYRDALAIKPDFPEAWNNLKFAVKALGFSSEKTKESLSAAAQATAGFAMMEYYLAGFRPHEAGESIARAQAAMPPKSQEELSVDSDRPQPLKPPPLPGSMVALLHFGRSGTGLLHSLIDGHPEISTLPGIFLRGFFNDGVWKRISSDGWRRLAENFANEFQVLFDAASARPTPGGLGEDSVHLGAKEGMTTLGDGRDEILTIDREKFCSEALRIISGFDAIDPMLFLRIVHEACDKTMGTGTEKRLAFYHIHNPDDFALLNFLRYAPDSRLMMMVREPIQSCESWVRIPFRDGDHGQVALRIAGMLFDIDRVCFRLRESVGVRLEDLKTRPEQTLRSLAAWMGVSESPELYKMTVQGKKWWGDPTSPDYETNKAMEPFGDSSTSRPVGAVFSGQDRLVLDTLFYPFSVRFGYTEPEPDGFRENLAHIRPRLDDMFDFERVLAERSRTEEAFFKQSGSFRLFHRALLDRWQVLDELGDYPGMLTPLEIPEN